MNDFVVGTVIWGLVTVFAVDVGFGVLAASGANDHNFDVVCINKNKSIQYRTLQGSDYSVKECK